MTNFPDNFWDLTVDDRLSVLAEKQATREQSIREKEAARKLKRKKKRAKELGTMWRGIYAYLDMIGLEPCKYQRYAEAMSYQDGLALQHGRVYLLKTWDRGLYVFTSESIAQSLRELGASLEFINGNDGEK